jgi:hypothetical protein
MTILISSIGKSHGWISQDSLWPGEPTGAKGVAFRWGLATIAKFQDHPLAPPQRYRVVDGQLMGRKLRVCDKAKMVVGMSGHASATVPIQDAAESFADYDAFVAALPALWSKQPPRRSCTARLSRLGGRSVTAASWRTSSMPHPTPRRRSMT